jgi:glycosyltransferase involved in cell wall biosynthesis
MKVLLVSNGFPPQAWGGTESYTAGLAVELKARGHDVQVLCGGVWHRGESSFNGYEDSHYKGVSVRRLNQNWWRAPDPCKYLYDNPEVSTHFREYIKANPPDLVHVTSCERLSASILRDVKEAGIPLVLSLTDFWFLCPRINLMRSDGENCSGVTSPWECLECQMSGSKAYRLSRSILPGAAAQQLLEKVVRFPQVTRRRGLRGIAADMDHRKTFLREALEWPEFCITASEFVRGVFNACGVTRPIHVTPYGHDLKWTARYKGKEPSEVLRFGFVGQCSESKGLHVLIQAARLLRERQGRDFRVVVYGNLDKSPSYGEWIRVLAEDLPNVEFAGTYRHENSAEVYANIDALVVPSLWYDFPLVIHEAFATKTPVLATNLGGMAESVSDGRSGLLFRRGDAADLAAKMERLLHDEALLARLQSGVPNVKSIREEVDGLLALYRQASCRESRAFSPAQISG